MIQLLSSARGKWGRKCGQRKHKNVQRRWSVKAKWAVLIFSQTECGNSEFQYRKNWNSTKRAESPKRQQNLSWQLSLKKITRGQILPNVVYIQPTLLKSDLNSLSLIESFDSIRALWNTSLKHINVIFPDMANSVSSFQFLALSLHFRRVLFCYHFA